MELREQTGLAARSVFALTGLLLFVATLASAYEDWPKVMAGHENMIGFGLICLVALPLSLLIVVAAAIGRLSEWRIGDDHIAVRTMSLMHWARVERVPAQEIAGLRVESFAYEDVGNRTAYWIEIRLANGKRLRSPRSFDAGMAEAARNAIEKLRHTAFSP